MKVLLILVTLTMSFTDCNKPREPSTPVSQFELELLVVTEAQPLASVGD